MAELPTPKLFISYAHDDHDYVHRLARLLEDQGLPVRYDAALRWGARFVDEIRELIRTACAVLVVMTPAAERSEWVQREILEAERHSRPLKPLLLKGDGLFLLAPLLFVDVRDGRLLRPEELADLRALCTTTPKSTRPTPAPQRTGPIPTAATQALPSLEHLLDDGDLLQADILTTSLILGDVNRQAEGWLRPEDGYRLSPSLLASIDVAWQVPSSGRYGFCHQQAAVRVLSKPRLHTQWQEFQNLALAAGWVADSRSPVPLYSAFVERRSCSEAFFPTLRNPQLEPYTGWHDRWRHTAIAVHRRVQQSAEMCR